MQKKDKTHIAILGRPNVGKSTLFNYFVGKKKAIVKNIPGVTRDILIGDSLDSSFKVIDTGGLEFGSSGFSNLIFQQVIDSLDFIDSFIFVLDAKTGLLPDDFDILKLIQKTGKNFSCVINKVDEFENCDQLVADFYRLGQFFYVSSFEKRQGLDLVREWIDSQLEKKQIEEKKEERMKISLLGKPNVGKSMILNQILGFKRSLVSSQSGTTLDSLEEDFYYNEKAYSILDTAGLRRSSKRHDHLEKLSSMYSYRSLKICDLCLLVTDIQSGLSHQDCDILESITEKAKPVILVINKTDLCEKDKELKEKFMESMSKKLHFFKDIPYVFVSAQTKKGFKKLFNEIEKITYQMEKNIPTSELNRFFRETVKKTPAPRKGTYDVKFYYLTKTKQKPPSFIAFSNRPEGVSESYRRFLLKSIKNHWGLKQIPIRLHVMKR